MSSACTVGVSGVKQFVSLCWWNRADEEQLDPTWFNRDKCLRVFITVCLTESFPPYKDNKCLKLKVSWPPHSLFMYFVCLLEPQHRMFLRREEKGVTGASWELMGWRWHQQEAGILFGPLRGAHILLWDATAATRAVHLQGVCMQGSFLTRPAPQCARMHTLWPARRDN